MKKNRKEIMKKKIIDDYIVTVNNTTDDYKDTYEDVSWEEIMQCWRSLRHYLDNVFQSGKDNDTAMIASGLKNEIINSIENGEKWRTHYYIDRAIQFHNEQV